MKTYQYRINLETDQLGLAAWTPWSTLSKEEAVALELQSDPAKIQFRTIVPGIV